MRRVSITEAKNTLSALLDKVRHGETIVIEDRGLAVAQLSPIVGQAADTNGDRIARLVRSGIVRPPLTSAPSTRLQEPPRTPASGVSLSQLVIQEREEGW